MPKGVCGAVESNAPSALDEDCMGIQTCCPMSTHATLSLLWRTTARAWLARDAQRLRLPTLYYWFKPDHQHLSEVSVGYALLRRRCCPACRGQAACRCVDQKRRG